MFACLLKTPNKNLARLKRGGHQHTHNFVRPAINALHARIGIHAADRIFVHIAIATEKLQAGVNNLALALAYPEFCSGGGICIKFAAHKLVGQLVDHARAAIQVALHSASLYWVF
ncbi:MAG: hypothetical protein CM15mP55_3750 [Hyphomicrobiales bacterium]|nr:MAG: hypothetical protein CM15mP55_3750 [Hyphomicrobiales bacterium]